MTLALIGLVAAIIAAILWFVRKGGGDAVKAEQSADTVKAAERVADAEANRVPSLDELRKQLSSGGKL